MLAIVAALVIGTLAALHQESAARPLAVRVCQIVSALPGGGGGTSCDAAVGGGGGAHGQPTEEQSKTEPDDPYDEPWY